MAHGSSCRKRTDALREKPSYTLRQTTRRSRSKYYQVQSGRDTSHQYRIDLDEIGMKGKIKAEIARHKKFQSGLLGETETKVKVKDVDIRNYARVTFKKNANCFHA